MKKNSQVRSQKVPEGPGRSSEVLEVATIGRPGAERSEEKFLHSLSLCDEGFGVSQEGRSRWGGQGGSEEPRNQFQPAGGPAVCAAGRSGCMWLERKAVRRSRRPSLPSGIRRGRAMGGSQPVPGGVGGGSGAGGGAEGGCGGEAEAVLRVAGSPSAGPSASSPDPGRTPPCPDC